MSIEEIEDLYFAFSEGTLDEEEHKRIEQLYAENAEVREVFEELQTLQDQMQSGPVETPPARISDGFYAALATEKEQVAKPKSRTIQMPVWAVAAGVSLLVGLFAGWLLRGQLNGSTSSELVAMQDQILQLQQVALLSQMEKQSASQRLATVQASYELPTANADIVNALVFTLRSDPSANVRLAAAEALAHFAPQASSIGPALADALVQQEDPLLQMSLIEMLIQLNEESAVDELNLIAQDEQMHELVRMRAQEGIGKLL